MKKYFLVYLIFVTFLSACTIRTGNPRAEDDKLIAKIRVGRSSKTDVKQLLGEPESVEFPTAQTEQWFYYYSKGHMSPLMAVPFVGLLTNGGSYSEQSQVFVEFSRQGIVKKVSTVYDKDKARLLLD